MNSMHHLHKCIILNFLKGDVTAKHISSERDTMFYNPLKVHTATNHIHARFM